MRQVLVIEDEKEISDLLEIHLTDLNCQVTKANDGKVGLDLAINEQFEIPFFELLPDNTSLPSKQLYINKLPIKSLVLKERLNQFSR